MGSQQTLSEADRRLVAAWAADCAERVLGIFEAEAPDDDRPRALIARTRAFARGELNAAEEIRRRFAGGVGAGDVKAPAAATAARAAGQAVAVCHMGAHALGAAAYAARAVGLADSERPDAVDDEIRSQLEHMSAEVRAALRSLPPVGEDSSGPLGGSSLQANSAPSSVTCSRSYPDGHRLTGDRSKAGARSRRRVEGDVVPGVGVHVLRMTGAGCGPPCEDLTFDARSSRVAPQGGFYRVPQDTRLDPPAGRVPCPSRGSP